MLKTSISAIHLPLNDEQKGRYSNYKTTKEQLEMLNIYEISNDLY